MEIREPSEECWYCKWGDNYFCWRNGDAGMRWSYGGPIANMRCTHVNEPSGTSWHDNYICVPLASPYMLTWSYSGWLSGGNCIKWQEDQTGWDNNYLCAQLACPKMEDRPAIYATPGAIYYNKPTLSNNGVSYPDDTEMTFYCAYTPLSIYMNFDIECSGYYGVFKLNPEIECAKHITKQDKGFRLLPWTSRKGCPSFMQLEGSKEDCAAAGKAVLSNISRPLNPVQETNRFDLSPGCGIDWNLNIIHNLNDNGMISASASGYYPLCTKGNFKRHPKTFKGGCPSLMDVSQEGCIAAGLSAGGRLRNGNLQLFSRLDAPHGCYLYNDGEIINGQTIPFINYNSNTAGVNHDGRFESLCHDKACPALRIPIRKYATAGSVSYNDMKYYKDEGNRIFTAGTVATLQCPYNPYWLHPTFEITCGGADGEGWDWDRDPVNECAVNNDHGDFRLLPKASGSTCPPSMFLSKADCVKAGVAVGGSLKNSNLVDGSFPNAPFGCSIWKEGSVIHYNRSPGVNNGDYWPVCNKGSFKVLPQSFTGGCKSMNIDKDECVAAGLSVGGRLQHGGNLVDGSFGNAPFGCSLAGSDNDITYNSQQGANDGNYASICRRPQVS